MCYCNCKDDSVQFQLLHTHHCVIQSLCHPKNHLVFYICFHSLPLLFLSFCFCVLSVVVVVVFVGVFRPIPLLPVEETSLGYVSRLAYDSVFLGLAS